MHEITFQKYLDFLKREKKSGEKIDPFYTNYETTHKTSLSDTKLYQIEYHLRLNQIEKFDTSMSQFADLPSYESQFYDIVNTLKVEYPT